MTPAKYRSPTRRHLERHLPRALLATACVTVLPVAITAVVLPSHGLTSVIAAIAAAIALSVLIAAAGKALWTRRPVPRELVFSDLMIWSWLNRVWIERRLRRASREVVSEQPPSAAEHIAALGRLERLLEARDVYTHGHSQRVTRHVEAIARAMHLGHDDITKILTAAAVHDVGKIYTPREVLNKPGKLTDGELQIIQRHPADGVALLGEIEDPEIRAMVHHHHERLDGRGYPDGLRGSAIPLGARIIAVADTFDAMTSSRAYRPAGTHRQALDVLRQESGRQLDPDAVAAFSSYYAARRPVAGTTLAAAAFQRIYAALGPTPAQIGGWTASLGAITLLTLGAHAPGGLVGHQRGDAPRVASQSAQVAPVAIGAATAAPVVLARARPPCHVFAGRPAPPPSRGRPPPRRAARWVGDERDVGLRGDAGLRQQRRVGVRRLERLRRRGLVHATGVERVDGRWRQQRRRRRQRGAGLGIEPDLDRHRPGDVGHPHGHQREHTARHDAVGQHALGAYPLGLDAARGHAAGVGRADPCPLGHRAVGGGAIGHRAVGDGAVGHGPVGHRAQAAAPASVVRPD